MSETTSTETTTAEAVEDVAVEDTAVEQNDVEHAEAPTTPDTEQADTEQTEETGKHPANAEAARYRKRAQAAEAERDALAGQLEALQRSVVDELVTAQRITPAGFWAAGVELADLVDDTGAVNINKVTAAVKDASQRLGLQPPVGVYIPNSGKQPSVPAGDSWESAFRPRIH